MRWALAAACVAVAAVFAQPLLTQTAPSEDLPVLDAQTGDHIADVLGRSSYTLPDLRVPPAMVEIVLTAFETSQDGNFFFQLRDGDKTIRFPWFPARGTLWMESGIINEIALDFFNFAATLPENRRDMSDGFDSAILGDRDTDLEAILDGYFLVQSLNLRPTAMHCYKNQIVVAPQDCPNRRLLEQKDWTRDALREEIARFMDDIAAAYATDNPNALDAVGPLVLGQWITSDGATVRLHAYDRTQRDVRAQALPWSERKYDFAFSLNIYSHFRALQALHVRSCYNDPDIPPSRVRYTPDQSQDIVRHLLAEMGPPVYQGRPITDPTERETLFYADKAFTFQKHWDEGWTYPGQNAPGPKTPPFCRDLLRLERDAGYTRP